MIIATSIWPISPMLIFPLNIPHFLAISQILAEMDLKVEFFGAGRD